ncbi:ImmA/IrrE family metallo-endopeptidase [Rhizobium sp. CRIBSB]|nr:ImmA/IrrE family metallo-endopeptidase [Rhizobium sp. CRIBSB]
MSTSKIEPEILGERLRVARSGANLTQEAAASRVGLSRSTLVAIEKGQRRVRPEELVCLADAYSTSAGKLLAADAVHVDLSAKFRRLDNELETPSVTVAVQLLSKLATGAVELERALGAELRADYPPPLRIASSGYLQQAEDAAVALRHRLGMGLGKAGDLFTTLELDMGVRVFSRGLSDGTISGLYAYDPVIGACILVNANHPRRRRQQTLAHEAAHFIADRSYADILDDRPTPLTVEERFARRFGYAFLMPSALVRQRFDALLAKQNGVDVKGLVLLAHQFDVTTEAMCRRLEELELLAQGAWALIKERGFNSALEREVLGDAEPATRPPLVAPRLAYLAARALADGVLSEGQICDLLVLDRSELGGVVGPFSEVG